MSTRQPPPTQLLTMPRSEFAGRFGSAAFTGAVCGYTREADTHAVLTLLNYARPRRVLEIGTAMGHMTANFTRWTLDDTQIFSLGIVQGMERSAPGAIEQQVDQPTRGQFGQFANHFGKAWKVLFIQADSMLYDFGRLAPLDFVFIDFGSLPKAWLRALHEVDEIWAYSRSTRDCYLEAGVPEGRVRVIPLGVDPEIFKPAQAPLVLPPGPGFRFLFVGGTIFRKGIDVLLAAFERAFQPGDDVGLVIKDMGSKSFYRGQTAEAKVAALRERGYSVNYIDRNLDEQDMARLYAACDCLVHPFRGEGFALPIVEAMACGLPVIVTGAGPVLDYASEETAFLIPARRGNFAEFRVGDLETIGRPWLWEPDLDALVDHLRTAVREPGAARAKGSAASAWIRGRFTWAHSAEAIERRLRVLVAGGEWSEAGASVSTSGAVLWIERSHGGSEP